MANTVIYRDFTLDFTIHPIRKDLVLKTDADAVVRSILHLLQTNHGERPFHPELGCNIRKLLFENISEFTARDIARFIEETINNFEPRARVQSLVVTPNEDEYRYDIMLRVFIETFPNPFAVNFILEKIR